jgi:hypothetical protein
MVMAGDEFGLGQRTIMVGVQPVEHLAQTGFAAGLHIGR